MGHKDGLFSRFYLTEISQADEVTPAADWWSVGALLYEIITGQVRPILISLGKISNTYCMALNNSLV